MANFIYLQGTDGKEWILNLDQIRMVTDISEHGITLIFDGSHRVNLTGSVVLELLGLIARNCVVPDGSPLPDFLERLKSR